MNRFCANCILLFFCFFFSINLKGQNLSTGPGFGYAYHSSLPVYSWHVGVGMDLFETKWSVSIGFQMGLGEGNRNFELHEELPILIESEHDLNGISAGSGNLSPNFPFIEGKVKTSHTTHRAWELLVNYNWLSLDKWKFKSGAGAYYGVVFKTFIFEMHQGNMYNPFYPTPGEVVYPEPYIYSFSTINASVASSIEYVLNDRVSFTSSIYYQHMNRFRGLLGIHSGIQVRL